MSNDEWQNAKLSHFVQPGSMWKIAFKIFLFLFCSILSLFQFMNPDSNGLITQSLFRLHYKCLFTPCVSLLSRTSQLNVTWFCRCSIKIRAFWNELMKSYFFYLRFSLLPTSIYTSARLLRHICLFVSRMQTCTRLAPLAADHWAPWRLKESLGWIMNDLLYLNLSPLYGFYGADPGMSFAPPPVKLYIVAEGKVNNAGRNTHAQNNNFLLINLPWVSFLISSGSARSCRCYFWGWLGEGFWTREGFCWTLPRVCGNRKLQELTDTRQSGSAICFITDAHSTSSDCEAGGTSGFSSCLLTENFLYLHMHQLLGEK